MKSTTIKVDGHEVEALPFVGDWLVRGTIQDRLTAAYFHDGIGILAGSKNFWTPAHSIGEDPESVDVRNALDYFWPGCRERNPGCLKAGHMIAIEQQSEALSEPDDDEDTSEVVTCIRFPPEMVDGQHWCPVEISDSVGLASMLRSWAESADVGESAEITIVKLSKRTIERLPNL